MREALLSFQEAIREDNKLWSLVEEEYRSGKVFRKGTISLRLLLSDAGLLYQAALSAPDKNPVDVIVDLFEKIWSGNEK